MGEMILVIGLSLIYEFFMAWIYVFLLLFIADSFNGAIKFITSLLIFIVFCPFFVAPLFIMIKLWGVNTWDTRTAFIMVCFAFVVSPVIWYLSLRMKDLRQAGYFRPKHF